MLKELVLCRTAILLKLTEIDEAVRQRCFLSYSCWPFKNVVTLCPPSLISNNSWSSLALRKGGCTCLITVTYLPLGVRPESYSYLILITPLFWLISGTIWQVLNMILVVTEEKGRQQQHWGVGNPLTHNKLWNKFNKHQDGLSLNILLYMRQIPVTWDCSIHLENIGGRPFF